MTGKTKTTDQTQRVKNNEKYTQQAQKYVANYLKTHPCVDCGETNIIALQFDHVRGDKKTTISEMCIKGYALQTIKDEIAKCDVRCGNCHSRKTAKENNSLAYRLLKEMQDE